LKEIIKVKMKANTVPKEFTILNLLKIFWFSKKFSFSFIIICIFLSFAYTFYVPYEYQSSAKIIPPDEGGGSGLASFLTSFTGGMNLPGMGQTNKMLIYYEILKSREIGKYITEKGNLVNHRFYQHLDSNEIYEAVSNSLEIKVSRAGSLQIISTCNTPNLPDKADKLEAARLSAFIANSSMDGLDVISRRISTSKAHRKKIYLERVLEEKKNELTKLDSIKEKFMSENKLLALDQQSQLIIANAASIGTEIAKTEIELKLKKIDYDDSSPIIKSLQNKLDDLRNQYARSQSGGITSDNFSVSLKQVPKLAREYTNIIRDQKILEQVNLYLETQKYQESIQEVSDVSNVEILERAIVPKHKTSPSKFLIMLMGFAFSIFALTMILTTNAFIRGYLYLRKNDLRFEDTNLNNK
jgi:uncharacterized protein involved in exopolysaccharide biosynthesis